MKKLITLLFFISFLLISSKAEAFQEGYSSAYEIDYSSLRLNEIMPNPEGGDTDYEWLELYNDSDSVADISGCLVDSKVIPEETTLGPYGYLVVAKDLFDTDDDGKSFEERWGDGSGEWGDSESENFLAVQLPISMKNSDDSVTFECFEYEDTYAWEVAQDGVSFSVDEDGEWTDEYDITPGNENLPVPEIVYNHTVQISEVYPSPLEDEEEWLELYNYGDEEIDLEGWILEDNTKKMTFGKVKIQAHEHLLVLEDDLSITLNNSGEKISLYDPNEELVDTFEYKSTDKGLTNMKEFDEKKNRYLDKVKQSQVPTQQTKNKYVDPSDLFFDVNILKIEKARKNELGSTVAVSGFVTVDVNLLGSKILYIQDNSAGIQVYLYDDAFAKNVEVGQKISLVGELKESNGETKIYIADENAVYVLESEKLMEPEIIETGKVDEKYEGHLVGISGEIVETSGTTFYIDDGSGKIKILIKSSASIETPKKKKGQFAAIVGIVSQYGDDSYRILPRQSTDIVISDEPVEVGDVLAATGTETILFQLLSALFVMLVYEKRRTAIRLQ